MRRDRRILCRSGGQGDLFAGDSPVAAACGVGVNSVAMLIECIRRGERIDVALFADVGVEDEGTYAYIPPFQEWLSGRGVPLITVRREVRDFKHWPAYRTLEEECLMRGTLPNKAFGGGACSDSWKIVPQHRWIRSWQPAIEAWASGNRVIQLIGFDCSPADNRRYRKRFRHDDPRYRVRFPLREFGWDRQRCIEAIVAQGLAVPPKSACHNCPVKKMHEVRVTPVPKLRRTVLLEARAKDNGVRIDGLWRKPIKGCRGATPRPGSMTEFIRAEGLIANAEIERIKEIAVPDLKRWIQWATHRSPRPEMSDWLTSFDTAAAAGMHQPPSALLDLA
ncbi:MAG: hypothetical protein ACJ8R9_05465 [Steroidobacteraceae bacterium]